MLEFKAQSGRGALPGPGPIVIALDGSPLAEQALPLATELARRTGARLHLVTVHRPVAALPPASFDPSYDPAWFATTETGRKEYLERIAGPLGEEGIKVIVAVPAGVPSATLIRYANQVQAGILVMTTHGRGGLNRLFLGSTLDRVLRKTLVPLLVVRSSDDPVAGETAQALRRILIPLDGSPLAEAVLEPAVLLGTAFGAEYELVRIVPPLFVIDSPYIARSVTADEAVLRRREAEAETYLASVRERLVLEYEVRVRTRVVGTHDRSIPDAVLSAAEEWDADVIALATHGLGGPRRMLLGSLADKVIRTATLPLFVVRPPRQSGRK